MSSIDIAKPHSQGTDSGAPRSGIAEKLPVLAEIAATLFPAPVTVAIESDPEIDGEEYFTFEVVLRDAAIDPLDLRREWYRRTAMVLGKDCDKVRLSIDIQS